MKPEVKQAWLEALRSGEYPQTQNSLHRIKSFTSRPVGFCCLGVLCEIAVKDNVVTKTDSSHLAVYGEGYQAFLPPEVEEWAGLVNEGDTDQGTLFEINEVRDILVTAGHEDKFDIFEGQVSVADLNDQGVPFDTIADIIEKVF